MECGSRGVCRGWPREPARQCATAAPERGLAQGRAGFMPLGPGIVGQGRRDRGRAHICTCTHTVGEGRMGLMTTAGGSRGG